VTSRATLARHPLSIAGALIATASFVAFVALAIASAAAPFDNPYAGLVIFIALPALFLSSWAAAHPGRHVAAAPKAAHASDRDGAMAGPGLW
jgi:hypothetical protein